MIVTRTAFERRISSALSGSPPRIPFVLGASGSGRTTILRSIHRQLGSSLCQYVDVERTATTPERFLRAMVQASPFRGGEPGRPPSTPREAFDHALAYLTTVRTASGEPATILLDEVLELRTFESFPGLRHAFQELLTTLAVGGNRFVLTSRYPARASRLLRSLPDAFLVVHASPMTREELGELLAGTLAQASPVGAELPSAEWLADTAAAIEVLSEGRPAYADAIMGVMSATRWQRTEVDPVSALSVLLAPDGQLSTRCAFCYELRLHRARGYGALKAILEVLSEEEPLTLTEVSQRLGRTPGSTKDYLSWLEDVDLVDSQRKRYRFTDPLLRLWVRLYCRTIPPTDEDVAREVRTFALARLPRAEAPAVAPLP
jgi:hypothetical protein